MSQELTGRIVRVDWPYAVVKTGDQVDIYNLHYYRITTEASENSFPFQGKDVET